MEKNTELKLPFACLKCPADNIVELIIDDGVELDTDMAKAMHTAIEQWTDGPFGLVVHKLNTYSVSFDAQQFVGDVPGCVVSAVVAYNRSGEIGAEYIISMSEIPEGDIAIFPTLENAVFWLQKRLSALQ